MNPSGDREATGAGFRTEVMRGGAITIAAQALKFAVQFGSSVVLARLLSPSDFGMVAMAAAVFGFVRVFEDLGLSAATVQAKELTNDQLNALYWVNVAFGLLLMVICMASAPALAWFFKTPEVKGVAMLSACSFLITAAAAQHRAVLTRRMRFGWLATFEIASMSCGLLVAVPLALSGFRYWTLVAMNLTMSLVQTSCLVASSGWRPTWPKSLGAARHLLIFGRNYSLVSIINYFARDFDKLLVGKVCGADALGIYTRAYNLFVLPLSQLVWPAGGVALPTLSRLQGDPTRFAKYYLNALYLIVFLLTPCSVWLAVMSRDLICVFFGNKWIGAAPVLTCLALSMPLQPVSSCANWLYVTTNRTGALLKYHFIGVVIICLSMLISVRQGPTALALAYSVAVAFWILPGCYFATRDTPVSLPQLFRTIYTCLLSGALAAAASLVLQCCVDGPRFRAWALILHGGVTAAVYFGSELLVFRQGPKLRLILETVKLSFSK